MFNFRTLSCLALSVCTAQANVTFEEIDFEAARQAADSVWTQRI